MILLMYYWIWFANVEDFCSFVHQGCVCSVAECVQLFAIPWTVAYQALLSMEFSRQEYWSGLLFPSPGDLPDPGIKPKSPVSQADALSSELPGKPQDKPLILQIRSL